MLLSSMNRLRKYIGGADNPITNTTANNAELMMWLTTVSALIEQYLDRNIHIESRTEYFNTTFKRERFFVSAFPIVSITDIYEDMQNLFNGTESVVDTTRYYPGRDGEAVYFLYPLGYESKKNLRVRYIGGMAYDPVQSIFTITKTGSWTVNNYVTGSSSGAVGILIADNTASFTIEVLYGVFSVGEVITSQTTEGGGNISNVSATITACTQRALCEAYPTIVTACEMEVRYNWKHKMDYELSGTQKDSTNRSGDHIVKGAVRIDNLRPETLTMLNPFRRYAIYM